MSHPILGLELDQLRRESLQFLMHNKSSVEYALFLNAFFATEYVNKSVLIAVAELLAGSKTGEG